MSNINTQSMITTHQELVDRLEFLKGKKLSAFTLNHFLNQHRGTVGNIVEYLVTGRNPNNLAEADISHLGIEIKTSQAIKKRDLLYKAKERLTLNMIDYNNENWLNFYESSYYKKNNNILLVILKSTDESNEYNIEKLKIIDYMFIDINSKSFENDLKVIKEDFETIGTKVLNGEAHLISEGDTFFLGAATKAANNTIRTTQPYSKELAKPRAFTYKQSYISGLIAQKLTGSRQFELLTMYQNQNLSFEDILKQSILKYRGKSVNDLHDLFGSRPTILNPKAKNLIPLIINRLLTDSKSDFISELTKADISIKTIRVKGKTIKESMSFPRFKFCEIVKQDYEDSDIYNMLYDKRFLFIVFKYDKSVKNFLLHDVMFWNMPFDHLETCKEVFDQAKKNVEYSYHSFTNAKNDIMHVRPHARNAKDVDYFPDGTTYTKQCFWLYNHYIMKQIRHLL